MSSSSRDVDRVCGMEPEEFRDVLEQLAFNKPQDQLVRELCAAAAKEESDVHSSRPTAWPRPGDRRSAPATTTAAVAISSGSSSKQSRSVRQPEYGARHAQQNGLNSQSLEDLVSMDKRSVAKGGRRMNKSSRANSFTQEPDDVDRNRPVAASSASMTVRSPTAATSSSSCLSNRKGNACSKNPASAVAGSGIAFPSSSSSSSSISVAASGNSPLTSSSHAPNTSVQQSRLSTCSPTQPHSLKETANRSSSSGGSNSSKQGVNNSDCDVESGRRSDSSSRIFTQNLRTYSNPCHSSSNNNNNNGAGNSRSFLHLQAPVTPQPPVHVCREDNVVEVMENAVELCEMGQKADIITYQNGARGLVSASGPHDVDSVVHFNKLESRSSVAPQFAELRSLPQEQGSSGRSGKLLAFVAARVAGCWLQQLAFATRDGGRNRCSGCSSARLLFSPLFLLL